MSRTKPFDHLPPARIGGWLEAKHGGKIEDLEPLSGGYWSSAFAYRVNETALVLRLSDSVEGFAMDADAAAFAPHLPVPEMLDRGDAFGGHYAITRRHHGMILEDTPVEFAEPLARTLAGLLARIRRVATGSDAIYWSEAAGEGPADWHELLRAGLEDRPGARWRGELERDPDLTRLFTACRRQIEELLPVCPERRDLIHGDLLHRNVLVTEDATAVTGLFSWKCSLQGDFLYDVAWCSFWGARYPALAAADMFERVLAADDLGARDLADAALRHYCYQVQIAASHFGWYLRTGEQDELAWLVRKTDELLKRGP